MERGVPFDAPRRTKLKKLQFVCGLSLIAALSTNAALAADSSAIVTGAIGGAAGAAIGQSTGGQSGAVVGGALGAALGVMLAESNEPAPAPVIVRHEHVEHAAPVEHHEFRRVRMRDHERKYSHYRRD